MKLHQLIYFLQAAKLEHIGKAAQVLAISPSAISHSIAALEEELGRPLFLKRGKRISLTTHGKLLLERASQLLDSVEEIKNDLTSDRAELIGTYRMAASHLLCPRFLAPAWARIQRGHPRLVAEINTLRSAQVLQGVADGELDFGLCFSPHSHPDVEATPLHVGQLIIAARAGHAALGSARRPLADRLAEHGAVLPKAYQGIENCETHPAFARHGIRPRVEMVYDNYEVAIAHLLATDAWGLLPEILLPGSGLAKLKIAEKDWDAPVTISALRPKNRITTRVVKRLLEELEKEMARPNGTSPASRVVGSPDGPRKPRPRS